MNLTFSFLADGEELQLPVSPVPFGWGTGSSPRELTVNGTGTLYLPGDPAARRGSLSFLLPAHNYPFCSPGAVLDPYHYIEIFDRWIRAKKLVRYVVPGVINARVVLEELTYEERDGSGDVYATLYLAESPALEAVTSQASAAATADRAEMEVEQQYQSYTVAEGDCLSVICRRYYGDGSAVFYNALARYNGISNPHLIWPGQVLTIPPKDQMGL